MRTGSLVAFCTLSIILTFLYLSIPITFKNGPTGLTTTPIWTGTSNTLTVQADGTLEINLNTLFTSDQPLTFLASRADKINTRVSGSTLTIEPLFGFVGERTIALYASDGETIARKRIKIVVTAEPRQESGETISPAELKVEPAIEEILLSQETVDAIIVLRETTPFTFNANTAKQLKKQILEQRKQAVDQAQDALLAKVNDVPAITGAVVAEETDLEIVHEYDTINALAVKLSRSGLAKLRNDPSVAQILLDKPFQAVLTSSVPVIDADDVWNLTANSTNITGKGEGLCILDTGIDLTHAAFTGKIVGGHDYVNEDTDTQDDAGNSHGTHVSGIAAGNSSTVKGVAPDANIIPLKVCNSGNTCTASDILAGIDYCNNNSVILNVTAISGSLSDSGQYASATCPTLFDSALNTSVALGIIPVFASGNNGYTGGISYPACSPYAISAGSTSDGDSVSGFSNRGGDRLDVFAPGESVTSAAIGGGTTTLSGTSMSTPHVTGAIGLIQHNQRAQNKPILTLVEMRQLLKETGKQVSSWHRIDVYTAIVKLNQNYSINITENSVTNATPPKAKVKFNDATDLSHFVECSEVKHNFAHVNSEQCPQYNKSAHLIFEGLPGINATPLRNGIACPPDVCQNATFDNGTLEFDVTSFTNYSGESYFGTSALVDGCVVINDSSSLTANVTSNGTCLTVNGSNLFLNCSGFTIHFDQDGTGGDGIFVQHQTNVTIQDCIIRDINASGAFGIGVNFSNVSSSLIMNTSVQTNGTSNSVGIAVTNGSSNQFINNTIRTFGTAANNFGIWGVNTFTYTNVTNNTITTNGTNSGQPIRFDAPTHNITISNNVMVASGTGNSNSGMRLTTDIRDYTIADNTINTSAVAGSNIGIVIQLGGNHLSIIRNTINTNGTSSNIGLYMNSLIDNSTIAHNTIRTGGTSANYGILLDSDVLNNITNNTIITSGSSDSNHGIAFSGSERNNVTNNTITTSGSQVNNGIQINGSSHNNILTSNNITTGGNLSFGIAIINANGSLINNTILTRPIEWVNQTANVFNNFSNTTFVDTSGSIRIFGVFQLNGTQNITKDKLNVTTNNRAYLNSTNLTFLNTSAQITMLSITSIDPKPTIDFEDDGVFTDCPNAICTEISFNTSGDNTFVYNVTQFTTYSSNDATIFSCATVNVSTTLTQDITSNTTCITFGSDNVTLDCANNTIFYNGNGEDRRFGVIAEGRINVTVKNCIIRDINASGQLGFGINFSFTNNSRIVNNTIRTNGTNSNHGILLSPNSHRNIVQNNTVHALGTANNNFGIYLFINSTNSNITDNTVFTNGTGTNMGIRLQLSAIMNLVANNFIRTDGTGANNFGIFLTEGTNLQMNHNNNTLRNNTIITSGTVSNNGIHIQAGSNNNTIDSNNISTSANLSYAVFMQNVNSTSFRNNFFANTVQWINQSPNSFNNFTNTTFANSNGTIQFTGLLQLNGTVDVSRANLNIRANQGFVNATNLTFMNTSARITLFGVSFTNPQPEVDFEDDGTFAPCSASICNEISYSGTTYVFDVTQFTAYQGGETTGGGGSVGGGVGGAAGGGGGGGDKKKKSEEQPASEQPTQDISRFLETRPTEQSLTPAETTQEQQEARELEPIASPEARQQRVTKSIALIFYLASFVSLAVLVVLWTIWHRRK